MFRYDDMDTAKGFIVGTCLGICFWALIVLLVTVIVRVLV
jgi:hypothetical protein